VASEQLFEFRGQRYAMLAVRAVDYIRFARPLSAKWQTVSMPAALFRQAAVPFDDLLPRRLPEACAQPIAAAAARD
jgi:hypothetical protein